MGVLNRLGAGRQKHLEVKQLWLQEKEYQRALRVHKVPREENPSDLLTHHWVKSEAAKFLSMMAVQRTGTDQAVSCEGACSPSAPTALSTTYS